MEETNTAKASLKNDEDYDSDGGKSNDDTNHNNSGNKYQEVSLGCLWDTLHDEFSNMGKALTCSLCLSTYRNPVVLPCVHAFCESCLKDSLTKVGQECPLCKTKATRRSMAPAPILTQMAKAYKVALRHFGLVPVQFDPSYNAMTQIDPGEAEAFGLTMEPAAPNNNRNNNNNDRRKSSNLVESHTQLLVSRTWQKVLRERQQQVEVKRASSKKNSNNNNSVKSNQRSQKQTLPANVPNPKRLNEWQQQQQASVIKSHERALINAAKDRNSLSSTTANNQTLSMQEEEFMEHALGQEVADELAENEEQEWLLQQQQQEEKKKVRKKEQRKKDKSSREQEYAAQHESEQENNATKDNATSTNERHAAPQESNPNPSASVTAHFSTGANNDGTQESAYYSATSENPSTINLNNAYSQRTVLGAHSLVGFATATTTIPEEHSMLSMSESFDTANSVLPRDNDNDNSDNHADKHSTGQEEDTSLPQNGDDEIMDTEAGLGEETNNGEDEEEEEDRKPAARPDPARPEETETTSLSLQHDRTPLQSNAVSRINNDSEIHDSSNNNNGDDRDDQNGTITNNIADGNTTPNEISMEEDGNINAAAVDSSNIPNESENSTEENGNSVSSSAFHVGDIVLVQSRTWPGVNKPGGMAKISRVVDDASYDVRYILGGREKNVDALFISLPPEEMSWAPTTTETANDNALKDEKVNDTNLNVSLDSSVATAATISQRERKSRRISTKRREIKVKKEAILPPDLMKTLKDEGFDVAPLEDNKTVASLASAVVPPVSIKAEPKPKRARSGSRASAVTTTKRKSAASEEQDQSAEEFERPANKKRGRTKQKRGTTLQATSKETQDRKDSQVNNKSKTSTNSKKNKTADCATKKRKTFNEPSPTTVVPSLPSTNHEICALANENYRMRVQAALDSSSLCVMASGLADNDKAALKALIKETKQFGDKVRIKLSDAFSKKAVTLCIVPASAAGDDEENLVGQCRTLKAMRCALAGIPLVTAAWITACRDREQVLMPLESMWVRSLPVKTEAGKEEAVADYGVAKMAAHRNIVLRDYTVHLFGTFDRPAKADVQLLLREAGANVSSQISSTLSQLHDAGSTTLVLVCDDHCTAISDTLYRQIKGALQKEGGQVKNNYLLVVNPQWLFDSIVCGHSLSGDAYPPAKQNGQPYELWKLLIQ